MPPLIFEQVKTYVISQPFLRTNFDVAIELDWYGDKNEFIMKVQEIRYKVTNISHTTATYQLRIFEEKILDEHVLFEAHLPHTRVTLLEYNIDGQPTTLTSEHEELQVDNKARALDIRRQIQLRPGQQAQIHHRTVSVKHSRDDYYYAGTGLTDGIQLTVYCPEGLTVDAYPMHPDEAAFPQTVTGTRLKKWSLDAGLLPYQAVELTWGVPAQAPKAVQLNS